MASDASSKALLQDLSSSLLPSWSITSTAEVESRDAKKLGAVEAFVFGREATVTELRAGPCDLPLSKVMDTTLLSRRTMQAVTNRQFARILDAEHFAE